VLARSRERGIPVCLVVDSREPPPPPPDDRVLCVWAHPRDHPDAAFLLGGDTGTLGLTPSLDPVEGLKDQPVAAVVEALVAAKRPWPARSAEPPSPTRSATSATPH